MKFALFEIFNLNQFFQKKIGSLKNRLNKKLKPLDLLYKN